MPLHDDDQATDARAYARLRNAARQWGFGTTLEDGTMFSIMLERFNVRIIASRGSNNAMWQISFPELETAKIDPFDYGIHHLIELLDRRERTQIR